MNITDSTGYNQNTLSLDNQNVMDTKINKVIAMMTTLTTQNNNQARLFKPKIYPGRREVKAGIITITEVGRKREIDQIAKKDLDHHTEVNPNLDITLGEDISEKDPEESLGTVTSLREVQVG